MSISFFLAASSVDRSFALRDHFLDHADKKSTDVQAKDVAESETYEAVIFALPRYKCENTSRYKGPEIVFTDQCMN